MPGAVTTSPASFNTGQSTFNSGRPYINGNREQANNFILDGMDNNESLVNTIVFFPNAEAIQEFRVDTSVAHLAAARGRPTWILLPYLPDFRWLLDRDDSPWYPTARLFRQTTFNDWAPVLDEVKAALDALACA